MSAPPLTDDQRGLLEALVERHAEDPGPVKRTTLAAAIGCHPVTVSNRMGHLRALELVESTSGPKGGYEPTLEARDVLADRGDGSSADVPVTSDGEPVAGVRIRRIGLNAVHDPRRCRGDLALDGPVAEFAPGDAVSVGPIPASKLRIDGVVVERDRAAGVVVVDIEAMRAPAETPSTPAGPEHEPHVS